MKKNLFFITILLFGFMACTENNTSVSVRGVTLSQRTVTLTVNETVTLFAAVLPDNATNQNVTWQSDNTAVATVNDGHISALSPGTAIITVTTQDGRRTATATVTVNEPAVLVTDVTLDRTAIVLDINESTTLIATVLPENATNQNVTWQSTNTSAATVNANGRVTAQAEGTTTIIVTTECGSRTATSSVTVNPPVIQPTGVELSGRTTILVGETETFTATISPANATNRNVTWISSNEAVATVDNTGRVSARAIGTATITVITEVGGQTASSLVYTITPTFDHGVDIGGIRWATRNVGAPGTFVRNPEDAGRHFQWNRAADWIGNWNGGAPVWWDIPPTWESANDPCPTGWRVPTEAELRSLGSGSWTTQNGENGRLFGAINQIFLPAAGRRNGDNGALVDVGTIGAYWSNQSNTAAVSLFFTSSFANIGRGSWKAQGYSIRCVADD